MTTKKIATSFADLALPPNLLTVVAELGYERMTPIQALSIPLLLAGKDVIGQSQTGSGKTAAFALPILARIRLKQRVVQALILCPTRELCAQVAREVRKLARRHAGLQVLVVAGGMPSAPQRIALENGVHIVVGTPGRALDLMRREKLDLRTVETVVLDEADRMLDMGFEEDMTAILAATPEERQTVFFSATFPPTIGALSKAHQRNPSRVKIDADGDKAPAIRQALCETAREDKREALLALVREHEPEAALVFCNNKVTVSEVVVALSGAGISAAELHGGLEQRDRDRVMARFRNHSVRVLVATDVAARGLDIEKLDMVLNFDLPSKPEVYVHRIGRTGRAGASGVAISLVTPSDKIRIEAIEALIGGPVPRHPAASKAPKKAAEKVTAPKKAEMITLHIGGGRKEKVRPGDILGALTGEAGGLDAGDIGKIEIHDHFTYVAVAKRVAATALAGLRAGRIKGRKFTVEFVD